ncbi:MAG: arsenite methyltransferase [bacterium]
MQSKEKDELRRQIRTRYTDIAKHSSTACGCRSSCCSSQSSSAKESSIKIGYSSEEIDAVPAEANMGLGCGNPLAIAKLKEGETVLDLGCGGGFDCFLAARQVGGNGHVIGIDMTPDMVNKARENARKANYTNVEFRLGEIECLPVPDNSVDVITSNCVINLSLEKSKVFHEAYRILKPGGRLAISDVIALKELPDSIKKDKEKHAGCVAGAVTDREIKVLLEKIGFVNIRIRIIEESRQLIKDWFPGSGAENYVRSATIEAQK